MARGAPAPLTPVKGAALAPGESPNSPLLFLLGPLIAVAAFTAALALIAAALGWQRDLMLPVAAGAGCAAALPALALLYRLRAQRETDQRALRHAQARVGDIVESAMDAIITIDDGQRIVLFNAAAEEVFGCPRAEAIGSQLAAFIPERFREAHAGHLVRFGQTGTTSRRMGGQRVVLGLRRNGEEFPIDASISQITEQGERYFTVILRDVTERQRAEAELRRSREEIRELALAASSAREQEKSRVARELHDELGQALTALKIDVSWLRDHLPEAAGPVKGKLGSMQLLLDGTVAAARRISSELRPLMLDDLGLVAACDWLVQNFVQRTGGACELVIGKGDLDLPDPYATAVFRVLQESLTNAARHSGATQVEVLLERDADAVMLTVRDNGQGFRAGEARKPGSYGLTGLRERAALLDGEVSIESAAGRGTVIELRLPTKELEPR
jgi:PAS domain S-box-containing protein